MRVYDITIPLDAATHIWDDGTPPRLETVLHLDRGDECTVTSIAMGSHSGTHVDAPAHFQPGGATVDLIAADVLVGPALMVEHAGEGHISAADLVAMGVDGRHQRVLVKTVRNRDFYESEAFRRDFVALDESAAGLLVEMGVRLVGVDYLSIEAYESADSPVHRALMRAGVVVLEGADLRDVPPGEYLLACAPLKMTGAEGAPARAFLIEGA